MSLNLEKLELLTTDVLEAMRDKIASILENRGAASLTWGSKVKFVAKSGETIYGRIERLNRATVSVQEWNSDFTTSLSGRVWRVTPRVLVAIVDKEEEAKFLMKMQAAKALSESTDKPLSQSSDEAW